MPAIDLVRHDDDLVVRVDLPGIKPEEVRIEVEDGSLLCLVSTRSAAARRTMMFATCAASAASVRFSRSIALPSGVDPEAIEAETRDGVVEVTIPLPMDSAKRRIEIAPTAASDGA